MSVTRLPTRRTGSRGRPRVDHTELDELVRGLLTSDPNLTASGIRRELGGRKEYVLAAVKRLRIELGLE